MRKVKYRELIKKQYTKEGRVLDGTGCLSDFIHDGTFHSFGLDFVEFEQGGCSYSAAIIEAENGEVLLLPLTMIRFEK